nr:ATP-binding cassette domain-containing protein [Mesoplasma coleopterae]AVN62722.1 hypothetical protein CG000_00120 [Mesoplasma coleopterae]
MANDKRNANANTWSKAENTKTVNAQKATQVKTEATYNKEIVDKYKQAIHSTNKPLKQKATAKKAVEPKIEQVKNQNIKKTPKNESSLSEKEQKLIERVKEKELIKQKLAEEKKHKKENKKQAKLIYKEQIQQEKERILSEKKAKELKMRQEAESKRIAAEKEKAQKIAQAQKLINEKKNATEKAEKEKQARELKMRQEAEAKKLLEEKVEREKNKESVKEQKKPIKTEVVKDKEIKVFQPTTESEAKREFIELEPKTNFDKGVKGLKQKNKYQKQLTNKYSKGILSEGTIVTTTNCRPNTLEHIIELKDVKKSYITGDLETPILKGIDVKLDKGDFIVILGPSGSGKTTFLNVISGLDKATEGDVFILGSNLSLLKDSHLTKFRRRNVGFIFQQYNLLTNLTSKENAEVGQNLANKNKQGMSIEEIFETIGMKEQMNKYPHQMSGGQQQRVSIARALAKNPEILFADEPTGALDEEMGRKVLEILVKVNREQKTTVVVVTHNPNIAKIANTVIHIKNGLIDSLEKNSKPADPKTIEWS